MEEGGRNVWEEDREGRRRMKFKSYISKFSMFVFLSTVRNINEIAFRQIVKNDLHMTVN